MTSSPCPEPDALITGGRSTRLFRKHLGHTVSCVDAELSDCEFDESADRWTAHVADGAVLRPRVVVLGPGPPRLPARLVGRGGMTLHHSPEAFLGVAMAGFPNLFLLLGPGTVRGHRSVARVAAAQTRYILGCLEAMDRDGATRIEVRSSVQRAFTRRIRAEAAGGPVYRHPPRRIDPDDYDLTSAQDRVDVDVYDGPALLAVGTTRSAAEVHLTGHLDPRDGHFHWYGRIGRDAFTDDLTTPTVPATTLQIGDGPPRPARLTERDPWGNLRVTGIGAPPYPVEAVPAEAP